MAVMFQCWCDLPVLRLSTEIADSVDGVLKAVVIVMISTSKFYELQNDSRVSRYVHPVLQRMV